VFGASQVSDTQNQIGHLAVIATMAVIVTLRGAHVALGKEALSCDT
jgi:hypothetical protein